MAMDGKRLADSALSTSMMVSFAIPGGAPFGALIAVGQFLFDLLYPPPPAPRPAPPPLTEAELTAALNDIKADIIDAIWKSNADHVTGRILSLNKGFLEKWDGMKSLTMDGERYILPPDDDTKRWIEHTSTYFDLDATDGLLTEVRGYRTDIKSSSLNDGATTGTQVAEHRTRTTGLYSSINSLAISYLKAAVMWKWGLKLREAWQWQEYQKKVDEWNTKTASFQLKNPLKNIQDQYPGVNLDPGYAPPEWNGWVARDPDQTVTILIKEVQDLLADCVGVPGKPGLYTTMRAHWDEYEALFMSHRAAFGATSKPLTHDQVTYRILVDSNPKMYSALLALLPDPATDHADYTDAVPDSLQMKLAIAEGQKLAAESEALLMKYALTHVSEQDITKFHENIEAWQNTAASVDFVIHNVAAGDTLADLADTAYNDPPLWTRIFELNSPPLTDANLLWGGLPLKIYSTAALPRAPLPGKLPDPPAATDAD